MDKAEAGLYSRQSIIGALAVSIFYLCVSYLLIGFKTDQLFLAALFNACFFLSPVTRKFILGFSIFIVYWIIFDYMKAFPNYRFNTVHIQDLYNAEKGFFGIKNGATVITPNEYWLYNGNTFLDILCGFFYLCWIPVPLAFAAYLFFKDKSLFLKFSLTFVLVNMIGFIGYYTYPAAPPWYVQLHGNHFIPGTPGNTAGLAKFDAYFNTAVFKNLYSKSSNVFAAMPSLHSSYPVIVLYYGLKKRMGWMNIVFAIVMVGIWFTAVYSSHHYVLDVLAGIICATIGIVFFTKVLESANFFRRFFNFLLRSIS
ncbi:MAG: phosphatase PAP2 family protein [Ferruginibacter sp.]